jgi:hypothetical protein
MTSLPGFGRRCRRARAREFFPYDALGPSEPELRASALNRLLNQTEKPVVIRVDPLHADQRLAAQQGFFLCKLIGQATFNQILMTMMIHPNTPDQPVVGNWR